MSTHTRPTSDAIVAHVADEAAADAVRSALHRRTGIELEDIAAGTGEGFARTLQRTDADDERHPLLRWLSSLGQEREELVRLGEAAQAGRYALVINAVDDEQVKDEVSAILAEHDARDVVHFGDWTTEDLRIS